VGAVLDDPATVDDDHPVGRGRLGEPVGDDEGGAAGEGPAGGGLERAGAGGAGVGRARVPSCPIGWPEPTVVAVTALVDALVHRLVDDGLGPDERARAEAVLWDNLFPVTGAGFALRLPADPRARDVADALLADPADARTLDDWGAAVGASRATLARHFVQDTGLAFARWRTQARVQAALDHLAAGLPVQTVARRVGYTDPSSFIATFRRATGRTPARWTPGPSARS
jgi:AraC-like DNA-binding protein